jgi:hypothetical protein
VSQDRHWNAPPPAVGMLDGEHLKTIATELDPGPMLNHREIAARAIRMTLGRDPAADPGVVLAEVQREIAEFEARVITSDAARELAAWAGRTR